MTRKYGSREKYFSGQHFCAHGYFVSTVGKNQKAEDVKLDQNLGVFPELK